MELEVMVVVKAAPVLTSRHEEAVCVAAVTLEASPRWIRLFPVPLRDMDDDSRFKKYQEIRLRVAPTNSDQRAESWTPILDSIRPGEALGTKDSWAERRRRLEGLNRPTMCELRELNKRGSGPDSPTLAIIETDGPPELKIVRREDKQIRELQERAVMIASQAKLFDDPFAQRRPLEIVPWKFMYRYRCLAENCGSHTQTIIDWEAVVLWRRVRNRPNWQELMRRRFVSEMWAADRRSELFVGNQHRYPREFLVLGVFWPPDTPLQLSLSA